VTGSTTAATSEAPRSVAAATEPQQVAVATTAVMTMAVTAPMILPVLAPVSGNLVAVVEVPDDDTLLLGWDQWGSLPVPAPEPPVGVLVMRDDDCVMSGCPADGAEASSSRAAPPVLDGTAARPEQERERIDATPAHFSEAHRACIVGGTSRPQHLAQPGTTDPQRSCMARLPGTRLFIESCGSSPLVPSASALSLICAPWSLSAGGRNWRIGPGRGTVPSTR
jgi:hypothetical protein